MTSSTKAASRLRVCFRSCCLGRKRDKRVSTGTECTDVMQSSNRLHFNCRCPPETVRLRNNYTLRAEFKWPRFVPLLKGDTKTSVGLKTCSTCKQCHLQVFYGCSIYIRATHVLYSLLSLITSAIFLSLSVFDYPRKRERERENFILKLSLSVLLYPRKIETDGQRDREREWVNFILKPSLSSPSSSWFSHLGSTIIN